jgi:hypothetical protein
VVVVQYIIEMARALRDNARAKGGAHE